jgi:hypothetical protein
MRVLRFSVGRHCQRRRVWLARQGGSRRRNWWLCGLRKQVKAGDMRRRKDALSRNWRRSATASRSFSSNRGSYDCDLRLLTGRRDFRVHFGGSRRRHTTVITTAGDVAHGEQRRTGGVLQIQVALLLPRSISLSSRALIIIMVFARPYVFLRH